MKLKKLLANRTANLLTNILNNDANTASSSVCYQPKQPKNINKFKKEQC